MLGKMYNNRIINSGKNVRRYNPVTQFENLKDTMLIRDRVYDALRREILSGGFAPVFSSVPRTRRVMRLLCAAGLGRSPET